MKYNKHKLIVDIYNKHLFTFILTLVDFILVISTSGDVLIGLFSRQNHGGETQHSMGLWQEFPSFLPSPQSTLLSPKPKKACYSG